MPDQPLVSIVTPSFNQGKFIEETIQSVLTQDYPNIEYWVIDGGSTDNTVEILQKYTGRIKWVSEPDSGQANAINKGWKQCRGEIFAWLNSDDLYKPGAVRAAVEGFRQHPEAAIVYGGLDLIDTAGRVLKPFEISQIGREDLLFGNGIGQPNAFIAQWALPKENYLNEQYHYVFDLDLWLRIALQSPAIFIDAPIANFRIHSDSKTYNLRVKFAEEWIDILYQGFKNGQFPLDLQVYKNEAMGRAYAGLGFSLAAIKDYRKAMPNFLRAIRHDPYYLKNHGVRAILFWGILGNRFSKRIRHFLKKESDMNPISDSIGARIPPPRKFSVPKEGMEN